MDSLPPPQDLVEDEVAAMSMRAMKEGVHAWPNLSDAERLLQVWRWLTDSETNLRTLRLRLGKEASLRREESEEASKKMKKEETKEKVEELEQDNRALAFELKEALKEVENLRACQKEQKLSMKEKEEIFFDTKLAEMEDRLEALLERQDGERRRWREETEMRTLDMEHQLENAQREMKLAKLEAERTREAHRAEVDRAKEVEQQLAEAYRERVEMARKCLEKEEEVTLARRARDVAEAENKLLQEKNKQLLNSALSSDG